MQQVQQVRYRRRRARALGLIASIALSACSGPGASEAGAQPADRTPDTLEAFQAAAARVLQATAVPGAGIALVRRDAVEWAGGIGYADRDRRTPVTADTHFRAGSITTTFVAMALVQLSEDGELDLDAPLAEVASDIAIDNPWHETDPVRIVHVLQHTAGFDDMHHNERSLPDGAAELPLIDVLERFPNARRVRWRPGTRMAYSNPGYTVAAHVLERRTGEPYEDYIAREIFEPLGMTTSGFRITADDLAVMAQGYDDDDGPPVGFPRIYHRPAGSLHSSPREMAQFVRMLLNWGELDDAFVIDPEYLGNMEQPRTTLAAAAGLRNGYGSGIAALLRLPYPLLGHGGGSPGFVSQFAYSPSRDVGFVVLLNRTGDAASEALRRLSSLAIRYLKRDVAPPDRPSPPLDDATLDSYTGYFHDANPREQILWPFQWLGAGRTVVRQGNHLAVRPLFGPEATLIPVNDATFRRDGDVDASVVFTRDADGQLVLAGTDVYAERRPRWAIERVRVPLLTAVVVLASVLPMAMVWVARMRRAAPRGFWALKAALIGCPVLLLAPAAALALTPAREYGELNAGTFVVRMAGLGMPLAATIAAVLALRAGRADASRWLTGYAWLVVAAMAGVSAYLWSHGLLGVRMWSY